MPFSLIPSFLFYCFISGITPGPANLCSLATAMKYGRGPALRQWRGLFTGFAVVSLASVLVTYFLGTALGRYVRYFAFVGAAYILWLALHILIDRGGAEGAAGEQVGFLTGLLVQVTNVKVMVFCLTALGSYVLPYTRSLRVLLAVGLFLPFTGPVANLVWLFAGASLQGFFTRHRRPLNLLMALSLVLCAVSLIQSAGGE